MKTMWKAVVIAAAVAGMQFIGMGMPDQASATIAPAPVKRTCTPGTIGCTSLTFVASGAATGGTGNLPPDIISKLGAFGLNNRLAFAPAVASNADFLVDLGNVREFDGIGLSDYNDLLNLIDPDTGVSIGLTIATQDVFNAYEAYIASLSAADRALFNSSPQLTIHPDFGTDGLTPQDVLMMLPGTTLDATAAVPEPSTVLLLGFGMAGLVAAGIRRRKNTASK